VAVRAYTADLHIHTVLSGCAEVEMIPPLIVEAAQVAGLDLIAITDHNSCENAQAVVEAARGSGIKVLAGMEVQTVENVHLLCLFDSVDRAELMEELVYSCLPDLPMTSRMIEEQMVVDSEGEFVRFCERPISLPTSLGIGQVWDRVNELGGITIPSHIDRQGTGMCGVLGMIPEEPPFEAFEVSVALSPEAARLRYPTIGGRAIIRNSDAHWLSAIGQSRTVFHIEHRCVRELAMACRKEAGRSVSYA
jgi:hypothetical protein